MLLPQLVRRSGALALAAGATALLSGCYGIADQTAAQRDVNGDVDVVTTLCEDFGPGGPDGVCEDSNSYGTGRAAQLFVSYMIPDGFRDPVLHAQTGALSTVTFKKAPADQADPIAESTSTPDNFHWVTFASSTVQTLDADVSRTASVDAPAPTTGPLTGTVTATFDTAETYQDLKVRTASSWRWLPTAESPDDADYAIDRPVVCAAAQTGPSESTPSTECLYSTFPATPVNVSLLPPPDPDPTTPEPTTPSEFQEIPTTRLEVLGPQSGDEDSLPTFTAGTAARVQFGQIGHVAPGAEVDTVALAGTTAIAGAVVSTDDHLKIGSEDAINVDVAIPASTPAGDYRVGVEAGERTGLRTAWQLIRVKAAPAPPAPAAPAPAAETPAPAAPAATTPLTVPQELVASAESLADALESDQKTRALRKSSAKLPFTLPTGGTVRVSLLGEPKGKDQKAPVLAVGTAVAKDAGIVDVKLRRTAEGKRLFASGKPITGSIVVRFWNRDGKTVSTAVPVTID